ncbi:hypothetical protein [Pseudaquabacterium pictum]|uniref:Bacteriophage phiJL001 Gp84 N-terminal domain-containing protein n=1 Tax=Pseudaquabacterium pictum TaxID=2315236 RepID=A0A480AKE2_9BURK|nr:hypothetical protein [Rubrivivax pictus]GCL61486.1 hypothetical protein AQPW35_05670 [Rubrivivax pictus]
MLTLDTSAQTQIDANVRGVQWLVALDFASGMVRYTTHAVDIISGGYTWQGFGQLVTVNDLRESEDGSPGDVTLGLSVVSTAMLAAAIGSVENYRNRSARLSLQLIGPNFQPVGAPVARWSGYMNKVRIKRSSSKAGSSSGSIEMVCSRAGANRSRAATGLRHTHAQHIQRFPGDNGFEYLQTLIDKPALWVSKAFLQR